MKAMLLAAGSGTRLKPFTNYHPKALAVINGKTLLQRNVEYLQASGIKEVIVNVRHFAEQIIHIIKENNGWKSSISVSDETDEVLETGGGLKRAAWFFKNEENFVLMNTDVLTDLQLDDMIAAHKKTKALATLATTGRITSRYFLFNDENVLCGWKNIKTGEEKPDYLSFSASGEGNLTAKAFSGIHVINTSLFSILRQSEKKFSMVDVYLSLCSTNSIRSFDHSQSKFIDVGKPESITIAKKMFK